MKAKMINDSNKTVAISAKDNTTKYKTLFEIKDNPTFIDKFKMTLQKEHTIKSLRFLCLRIMYIPVSIASVIERGNNKDMMFI